MTREEMITYLEEKRNDFIRLYYFCERNGMYDRSEMYISRMCAIEDIMEELFGVRYGSGDPEEFVTGDTLWK